MNSSRPAFLLSVINNAYLMKFPMAAPTLFCFYCVARMQACYRIRAAHLPTGEKREQAGDAWILVVLLNQQVHRRLENRHSA